MEHQVLIQKLGTHKKTVNIKSDNVLVHSKTAQEELAYRIKFEELGFEMVRKRVKSANIPFYAFIGFSLLNSYLLIDGLLSHEYAMAIFWLIALGFFGGMAAYAYLQRNRDMIYLTGGDRVLELMANRPNEETVEHFIQTLHQHMRIYFKNKYLMLPPDTPLHIKFNQLNWLKDIEAINEEEHQQWMNDAQAKPKIGFSNGSRG